MGRHLECALHLPYDNVSRRHARVLRKGNAWWIEDLGSSNGTYVNGTRISTARLPQRAKVQLGVDGPVVSLLCEDQGATDGGVATTEPTGFGGGATAGAGHPPGPAVCAAQRPGTSARIEGEANADPGAVHPRTSAWHGPDPAVPPPVPATGEATGTPSNPRGTEHKPGGGVTRPSSVSDVADYYFRDDDDDAGEHTQMVRQAFRLEQARQTRSHRKWSIGLFSLAAVLVTLLGFSVVTILWQNQQVARARNLAIDLFYDIKTLEIDLAQIEERVRRTRETTLMAEMQANRRKLQEMSRRYQQYVDEMETKGPDMSEEDLAILHVARLFGECELTMPDAFKEEVKAYIGKWRSSGRLARAMRTLEANGYLDVIHEAMSGQDLPAQFLYLSLQESNFNARAIGPETRYGIAKGAWQFIPDTATRFGLTVGPLIGKREHDPDDERFDFAAATKAAARYLRYIYNTDAQASGLLVMASYNWGEGNIIKRIRTLPENPRQRNFWELVNNFKIPDETYNYVLHIVSAAVIGENPQLFGFDFENPLEGYESTPAGALSVGDSS